MKEIALEAMKKAIEADELTNELVMRVILHCMKLLEEREKN